MRILMRRCNRCSGCCAVNCGLCRECQDKPAFGGKGIRKKLCRARRCQNPQSAKAAAAKAATVSRTADLLELMLPGGRQELVDREFAAPALPTATAVAATHAVGGSVASSSPPSPTSAELLERARAQLVPLGSRGVPTNDATPSFCALSSPNCDFAVTAGTPEARDTTSEALRVLAALCDPHADTDASGGSSGGGGEEGGGGGEEGGAGECRGDYGEASDRWDRGPQPEDEMEELLGELLSSLESDDLLSQPSVSPSTSLGDAASTTTTSSTTTTAATTTSSPGESTRPVSSLTPLQASCHRIGSLIELEFRSLAAGADLPREQQLRLFGAAAADRSAVLLRLQAVLHAMVSNLATSSAGSNDPAAVAAVLRIVTAAEVTLADGSDLPVPPPLLPALAAAMRAAAARQSALAPVPSPLPSPPEPTLANSPLTKSPLLSLPRRKPRTGRLATPGYLVAALGRRVGGSVRFWARHRLLGQGLPLPGGGVCGYSATPERVQAGALCIFWCQILLLRAAEERGFLTETADGCGLAFPPLKLPLKPQPALAHPPRPRPHLSPTLTPPLSCVACARLRLSICVKPPPALRGVANQRVLLSGCAAGGRLWGTARGPTSSLPSPPSPWYSWAGTSSAWRSACARPRDARASWQGRSSSLGACGLARMSRGCSRPSFGKRRSC